MMWRPVLLLAVVLPWAAPAYADDGPSPRPARHGSKPATSRRPAAGHPSPVPQTAVPAKDPDGTIPMDFSGMERSVSDIKTPSNSSARPTFGNDQGSEDFHPAATFHF